MENTRIYLIRHAESMGNVAKIFQGRTDEKLSENGVKQLEELKEFFRDIPLDAVYTSPLTRARETAGAVAAEKKLPVILNPGMIEIDGGRFEGRNWREITEAFPDEIRIWTENLGMFSAPDGESAADVYKRVVSAVNALAAENKGRTIAVVSHGFAIRCYMCYAKGFGVEGLKDIGWLTNTGYALVTLSPETGEVLGMESNQTENLFGTLPSI